METELISIIIPVYNVENYLRRCLDSVRAQEYKNIEVILVDDGSKDASGIICDEYAIKDNRFTVIHKTNGGLSEARNFGLEKSNGQYLYFLDSDDWISKDCIRKLYHYLINNNLDIAVGSIGATYENGYSEPYTERGDAIYSAREALFDMSTRKKICVMSCNKLYRKCIWSEIVFPVGRLNEDEFTTYKVILNAKKIGYLDNVTYYYFQRDGSISHSTNIYLKRDAFDAFEEKINCFNSLNYYDLVEAVEYLRLVHIYNAMSCEDLGKQQKIDIRNNSIKNGFLKFVYPHLGLAKSVKAFVRVCYIRKIL